MKKKHFFIRFLVIISLVVTLISQVLAEDLLIICPGEFQEDVQPLVTHKNASGMPTLLRESEWIYGAFWGVDEAEQVKNAIRFYHENRGIKYVLLFGDVDKIPVRWVTRRKNNDPDTTFYYIPSDLYYADLYDANGDFCTWDSDHDGYFGEHLMHDDYMSDPYSMNADHMDLHPDVAVGRVPASFVEEVEIYVSKVITYEYKTAYDPNDWFHNVLLLAGPSGRNCDAGIHFYDIKEALGVDFNYKIFISTTYYTGSVPCICNSSETEYACLGRTKLNNMDQIDIFVNTDGRSRNLGRTVVTDDKFENIGFLGWHGHTSSVRNYYTEIDNNSRYTVAFTGGCNDGGFAGYPIGGKARFKPVLKEGHDLPYKEIGGHVLQVIFDDIERIDPATGARSTEYGISGCEVDGIFYPREGNHCSGGFFPDMILDDDEHYINNAPRPHPLQPGSCDYDLRNPGTKLFSQWSGTGEDTGWIGLVAATMGAQFCINGELEALFFTGYRSPHPNVGDSGHLGDMWRSMLEYWLTMHVFDESGNFDFVDFFDKYSGDWDGFHKSDCFWGITHSMMYVLFGDPSLRIGGVTSIEDDIGPLTTDDSDHSWHNHDVSITFTATDRGSTPSGVRRTRYRIDGKDWQTGSEAMVEAPADHSHDGIHVIEYFSIDFLGNIEAPVKRTEVKIDTYPPDPTVLFNGAPPALIFCLCPLGSDCDCPEQGCYNNSVTITLSGTDGVPEPTPHEQWNRPFAGIYPSEVRSVCNTDDEGYIISGWVENSETGVSDLRVLKTDSEGFMEWSESYRGDDGGNEASYSIRQITGGGYIIVGHKELPDGGGTDIRLIKLDPNRVKLHDVCFGGPDNEYAYCVRETSDGGFIIAGTAFSGSLSSAWIIKTNENCVEEWNRHFGGTGLEKAYDVKETGDHKFIIIGETTSHGAGSADAWLIKIDPSGDEEWNQCFGGPLVDTAFSVEITADGDYIIAGRTHSLAEMHGDAWLIKTDSSGDEEWSHSFGGVNFDEARDVKQTPDGGYILLGNTISYGVGMKDVWLIKTDSNGVEEWNRTFGGTEQDEAFSIQLTPDGGYILAGYTCSNTIGQRNAWLVKVFFNNPIASGYDHSEYYYGSALCAHWFCPYTSPLTLGAGSEPVLDYDFQYRAYDAAGNYSYPIQRTSFCVTDWVAGLMRVDAEILAALEDIIAMKIRPSFELPFDPPAMVRYEYGGPIGQGEIKLVTIGTNTTGKDDWGVMWDTRKVPNGDYFIRMTAFGEPPQLNKSDQPNQPQDNVYEEEFMVTVCNIPESDYLFTLSAPDEVQRGDSIEYTLTYVNNSDLELSNLCIICILDDNAFYDVIVQDNGNLNEKGFPVWNRYQLKSNEVWKVHITGGVRQDIAPGRVITAQAFLSADTIPHLLSDDPMTNEKKDRTRVSVKLENGAIYGKVLEYKYKAPISARVSIKGPYSLTEETDDYGKYRFSALPPGTYQVIPLAEGYQYHLPDTFITVEIDGSGESIWADFLMERADSIPPQSQIDYTMEQIIEENITRITGTASDLIPGSGLNKVEISVTRSSDYNCWDGNSWEKQEVWSIASGTSEWLYDAHGIVWDANNTYTILSRAIDKAGNVGTPYSITNVEDLDLDDVDDSRDNCPGIENPDQLDTDKDTAGDACDPDDDNDGLPDEYEQEKTNTDPLTHDTDDDGISDCAEDPDDDGFTNIQEYENNTDPLDGSSYPGAGITINMKLDSGWSMISLPVVPGSLILSQLFPGASVVYGYEKSAGYIRIKGTEGLEVGKGYWILLDESQTFPLIGQSIKEYILSVENGWYMIGGCTDPAKASIYNGTVKVIYGYLPHAGYQRVPESEKLMTGKGYWILLNDITNKSEVTISSEDY